MTTPRKEVFVTLLFFVLFLVAGHLGIWFVLFPVEAGTRLLGFPAHYTIALLVGWPGLLVLVAVWARVANRLDDEIAGREGATGHASSDGAADSGPDSSTLPQPSIDP